MQCKAMHTQNEEKHEQSIEAMAPKLSVCTFDLGEVRPSSNGSAEVLNGQALPISCGLVKSSY